MSANNELQAHTCEKMLEFYGNIAKNVAQRNSQDLERVADTSKTLDHIVDTTEKVSLTDKWKRGELEQGYYYTRYTPSVGKPFVEIELRNYLLDLAKVRDAETVEILAPVPSYEEYEVMKYLSSRFSVRHFEAENQRLKSYLRECREYIGNNFVSPQMRKTLTEIDEVLK
jgi:hypothetical protein